MLPAFRLQGLGSYIQVQAQEVFGFPDSPRALNGGYDCRGTLTVKSGSFLGSGPVYFSTGDIYTFYEQLQRCHAQTQGTAHLSTFEGELELLVDVNNRTGHLLIQGTYRDDGNVLQFEFGTDQSFLPPTLAELAAIVDFYGDRRGKKG